MYYSYLRELETKLSTAGDLVIIRRDDTWVEYIRAKFSFCFRQDNRVVEPPNAVQSTVTGMEVIKEVVLFSVLPVFLRISIFSTISITNLEFT